MHDSTHVDTAEAELQSCGAFDFSRTLPDFWPEHLQRGSLAYLLHGRPMGGYLSYLFAGDLFGAACNADPQSRAQLVNCARWIAMHCPVNSHGSMVAVQVWCEKGGLEG